MTALTTAETPAAEQRSRSSRGPHGLTWALLRVHRSALWFWILYVAVTAGVLLWTYGPGANAALDELVRSGCRDGGSPDLGCDLMGANETRWGTGLSLGSALIFLAPFLIAAWAGGSLIGRELEDGTARLAWTQSVSPGRWLAAKLTVPAVLIVAGMLPLTLLHRMTWAAHPELRRGSWSWFDGQTFTANGILATAYALAGLALGVLAGMVTRRSLPGLGIGLVAVGIVVQRFQSLRPHLWLAETLTRKGGYPEYIGMVVRDGVITSNGSHMPDPYCDDAKCRAASDVVGYFRDYHPASHFWPLQLVESGILLALAAAAALIAFALLKHRTGATP
jgi:hypothetical protein